MGEQMPLSRIMLRTDRSAWENTTRRAAQAVAGGLHPIMMIVHISTKRVVLSLLVEPMTRVQFVVVMFRK